MPPNYQQAHQQQPGLHGQMGPNAYQIRNRGGVNMPNSHQPLKRLYFEVVSGVIILDSDFVLK